MDGGCEPRRRSRKRWPDGTRPNPLPSPSPPCPSPQQQRPRPKHQHLQAAPVRHVPTSLEQLQRPAAARLFVRPSSSVPCMPPSLLAPAWARNTRPHNSPLETSPHAQQRTVYPFPRAYLPALPPRRTSLRRSPTPHLTNAVGARRMPETRTRLAAAPGRDRGLAGDHTPGRAQLAAPAHPIARMIGTTGGGVHLRQCIAVEIVVASSRRSGTRKRTKRRCSACARRLRIMERATCSSTRLRCRPSRSTMPTCGTISEHSSRSK